VSQQMKFRPFSFRIRFFVIALVIVGLFFGLYPHTREVFFSSSPKLSQRVIDRPYYQIEATYNPRRKEVSGQVIVTLPEKRIEPQSEVYFHLYPNVFHKWKYGDESKPTRPGYIQISQVKVDGKRVQENIHETIMKVPLPQALPAGKSVRIEMDYKLHLPQNGTRLNTYNNTAFLAQWYPMLAVKDQEGWHTDPYTTTGDPFYSEMSDFEVTFHVPSGYQVISTGMDADKEQRSPIAIQQKNVRDFAAVITKDYQAIRGKIDNIQVNLWYLKGMEDVSKILHDAAMSGMKFYNDRFGKYPYEEVDVVLGETGHGIAGMEYPGLVTSVTKVSGQKGEEPAINVVVHELAHQWWYGVVGNNQVKEPWLDEGLTTFSEFFYMQEKMKEDEKALLRRAALRINEIHKIAGVTSVESLYKYSDSIYGLMVYIRPAAMLFNLMEQIGEEKVLQILRTYYERYQYKIATTADFIQVANEVAGKDLSPFFQEWLYFKGKK
jgi:aminopeptidase N